MIARVMGTAFESMISLGTAQRVYFVYLLVLSGVVVLWWPKFDLI